MDKREEFIGHHNDHDAPIRNGHEHGYGSDISGNTDDFALRRTGNEHFKAGPNFAVATSEHIHKDDGGEESCHHERPFP